MSQSKPAFRLRRCRRQVLTGTRQIASTCDLNHSQRPQLRRAGLDACFVWKR